MRKLAIRVCVVFFLLAGQAWGTETTLDFHGVVGLYEDRLPGVEIFPWTFVGVLIYDESSFSVIDIELTQMYVNDQRLYGGPLGKGPAEAASLVTSNGEIIGIDAVFPQIGFNTWYTDPNNIEGSMLYGYNARFGLVLHPPGDYTGGYRDPPDGVYDSYERTLIGDPEDYIGGSMQTGYRYTINERFATIDNLSDRDSRAGNATSGWGTYEIGPVPEPTNMLLFGVGLVGLAGFGRKRFKK